MVPAQTLPTQQPKHQQEQQHSLYSKFGFVESAGAGYSCLYYNNSIGQGGGTLISNPLSREPLNIMADEQGSATNNESGSTSNNAFDAGWLRLSIGGTTSTTTASSRHHQLAAAFHPPPTTTMGGQFHRQQPDQPGCPNPFEMPHDVIKVVDPPPRPHSGIWFMLQPSLHQAREPFLPQLARNIIRIKDGRMTVRLLIKYLVNKLGLERESEIEIRCRGEEVQGNLTMQQVRDEIWSGREAAGQMMTLRPHSSTADHVMLLHYATSSSSSNLNY